MKGILHKTEQGWIVIYDEGTGIDKNQNSLPLENNGHIDGLKLYDSNEGLEVDFEIVTDYDNNGPNHFPVFARILTPEDDEPCVSDDFQIGPDGAYKHIEYAKSTMVFAGEGNWGRSAYIKLEDNKVIFDCSDEEYGPIVFDIDLLKDALNKHII